MDPDDFDHPDYEFSGQILYDEAVKIEGSVGIESGTSGTGRIEFEKSLDGDGSPGSDYLLLNSADGADNIFFRDEVGGSADPLEGLSINKAHNVTFDDEVTIDGDLTIVADGTVTFHAAVVIKNGGSLTILDAASVVFEESSSLTVDQDIYIEADEIDFQGGDYSVSSVNGGRITLEPNTVSTPIEIASPPNSLPTGNLNLTVSDIEALADGFSAIVIGREDIDGHAESGTGKVRIGVGSQFGDTFFDALEIYGGSIEIVDYPNPDYILQTGGTVLLDAVGNITVSNTFRPGGDLTIFSDDGKIRQLQGVTEDKDGVTNECLIGTNLIATAQTGLNLQWTQLDTIDVLNEGSGNISINEVAAGGDVSVKRLEQSAIGTNGIQLTADAGTITILSDETGVTTAAGSGAITLNAQGSDSDVLVNDGVTSSTGTITIIAADMIQNTALISATGAGAINLAAGDNVDQNANIRSGGGLITVAAAAGGIDMADGTTTASTGGAGSIDYTAHTGVALSILDAATTVSVTAVTGAITEQLSSGSEDANILGTTVTLSAVMGIGTSTQDIDTHIDTLIATNSTSGGIFIQEANALILGSAGDGVETQGGNGPIVLRTVAGDLTVSEAVRANGSGNIRLEAEGALTDVVLDNTLTSGSGNISIVAGNAVGQTADGDITTNGGTIDVRAVGDAVTMATGAVSQTTRGNIRYEAGTAIVLGLLDTRTATGPGQRESEWTGHLGIGHAHGRGAVQLRMPMPRTAMWTSTP